MTKEEVENLLVGDVVRVEYNGISCDYSVSEKTDEEIFFQPVGCGFSIKMDSIDKWKISTFKLMKRAKRK